MSEVSEPWNTDQLALLVNFWHHIYEFVIIPHRRRDRCLPRSITTM